MLAKKKKLIYSVETWKNKLNKPYNITSLYSKPSFGKTTEAIKQFYQAIALVQEGFIIAPVPPFYREKHDEIAVLGVENRVWLMKDASVKGQCSNPVCLSKAHFFDGECYGHVFFYDIDEKVSLDHLAIILNGLMEEFQVSNFIITETTKGYHIWSLDIRKNKVAWFPLFKALNHLYPSDYEFMGQWILRLGSKRQAKPPKVVEIIINHHSVIAQISLAHLSILMSYAGLLPKDAKRLKEASIRTNSFAKMVIYHSWKID